MQKISLTTGGQTWKFHNLSGKGPSTGVSLLFVVLQGRLTSSQSGALTTPLTPSLVPTTFSRFQQEKSPTLSTSHTNQPSQIRSLCWCLFGPYVEFQLLHYFAYSTNFTSNILPNQPRANKFNSGCFWKCNSGLNSTIYVFINTATFSKKELLRVSNWVFSAIMA